MTGHLEQLEAALAELPDAGGGSAVLLATSASPPALALLSTGDVALLESGRVVACGVHASSSVVRRRAAAFTLLVPVPNGALRVEAAALTIEAGDPLARVTGTITDIRPTTEPPWELVLRFQPSSRDDERIPTYVDYWRGVRAWLEDPARQAPQPPG